MTNNQQPFNIEHQIHDQVDQTLTEQKNSTIPAQEEKTQQKHEYNGQSIFHFFIEHSRLTTLAVIAILFLGFISLGALDIEANPDVEQPIGIVQTFYPNSTPEDIEEQVTEVIEEAISGQGQIDEITSSSGNNVSTITVTYESDADTDEVLDELRTIVSRTNNQLPDEAETPEVIEIDFNAVPIVSYSIASNERSLIELDDIAEDVSEQINNVSGVSSTELSGTQEQTVKIILSPQRLALLNITLNEVIGAINASNVNSPLGEIEKTHEKINLRLVGKIDSLNKLRNLPIRNASNNNEFRLITLEQVSEEIDLIVDQQDTLSAVSANQSTYNSAITLQVFKSTGGNIINIVEAIDTRLDELRSELPDDIEIIKTNDNAFFIRKDIRTLATSGLQTVVIIFFSLLIFLSLRESFIASLAIPIIFLITIATIYLSGQTLNGLSIFSLILSLGLIVDTSIVIVEGIHEFKNEGYSPTDAAKKALDTYKWPLIAGTATSIAAFFPMLLVGGIVGEFIRTIPITLNITLIASLFVSFAISPLIASKLVTTDKSRFQAWKEDRIAGLKDWYRNTIDTVLHSLPIKIIILVVTVILFVASMSLPVTGKLVAELFPVVDTPFLYINFSAPSGTSLERTRELAEPIEALLQEKAYIDNYVLLIGRQQSDDQSNVGGSAIQANTGSFVLNFTDIDETDRPESYVISEELRTEVAELASEDFTINVLDIASGPPTAADFEIRIKGPGLDELKEISLALKDALEQIDGLINVNTAFDNIPEEATIKLNQDLLAYYGISNQQASQIIRTLTSGLSIGSVELNDEDYDLDIYFNTSTTKGLADLDSLPIVTPKGEIPLSYIAEITTEETINSIPRIDEERSVRVRASTTKEVLPIDVADQVQAAVDSITLPEGTYSISVGGEDEDIQESFAELFSSMIIAVVLILIILVLIFNSFRQTGIVLMTIPFSIIGIFPGLVLTGLPLSFPAFLGVVMLTGIVVNDAIVLMDQINNRRAEANYTDLKTAIAEGASSRLVPVLLTSITTILGLLPISLKDEFWRGLGFSVIFGLVAATFLTLLIIPILYSLFYRKSN